MRVALTPHRTLHGVRAVFLSWLRATQILDDLGSACWPKCQPWATARRTMAAWSWHGLCQPENGPQMTAHRSRQTTAGPDKPEGGRPPSSDSTKPLNSDDSQANQQLNGTPIPPQQPCFTSSSNLGVFMETNEGMSSKRSGFDRAPKSAHKCFSSQRWHVMIKAGWEETALAPPGRAVEPGLCPHLGITAPGRHQHKEQVGVVTRTPAGCNSRPPKLQKNGIFGLKLAQANSAKVLNSGQLEGVQMGVKHKLDIPMLGSRVTAPCCSHQPLNTAKTGPPVNQPWLPLS